MAFGFLLPPFVLKRRKWKTPDKIVSYYCTELGFEQILPYIPKLAFVTEYAEAALEDPEDTLNVLAAPILCLRLVFLSPTGSL